MATVGMEKNAFKYFHDFFCKMEQVCLQASASCLFLLNHPHYVYFYTSKSYFVMLSKLSYIITHNFLSWLFQNVYSCSGQICISNILLSYFSCSPVSFHMFYWCCFIYLLRKVYFWLIRFLPLPLLHLLTSFSWKLQFLHKDQFSLISPWISNWASEHLVIRIYSAVAQ